MHIREYEEDVIKYINNEDMLSKLFYNSLKNEALKWHFSILERSMDSYKYLVSKSF